MNAPADREKRARADRISGLILAALMLSAFALVLRTILAVASGPVPASPGKEAPAFVSVTPDGAPINLADHKNEVVMVDFWATWCPPCVASMPALQRLYAAYKDKGFVILGVNQEAGDETTVRAFLKDHQITFPIVMDAGKIAHDYGVFTFPTTFLIARDGKIHGAYRGVASESRLRNEIEELLEDRAAGARGAND